MRAIFLFLFFCQSLSLNGPFVLLNRKEDSFTGVTAAHPGAQGSAPVSTPAASSQGYSSTTASPAVQSSTNQVSSQTTTTTSTTPHSDHTSTTPHSDQTSTISSTSQEENSAHHELTPEEQIAERLSELEQLKARVEKLEQVETSGGHAQSTTTQTTASQSTGTSQSSGKNNTNANNNDGNKTVKISSTATPAASTSGSVNSQYQGSSTSTSPTTDHNSGEPSKIFDGVGKPHPGQIFGATPFKVADPLVGIGAPDPDNKYKYGAIDVGNAKNTEHQATVKGHEVAVEADQAHKEFLENNKDEIDHVMSWLEQEQKISPSNRQPVNTILQLLKERIQIQEAQIKAEMMSRQKTSPQKL